MISVISPAKTLDLESSYTSFGMESSHPLFASEIDALSKTCKNMSADQIKRHMHTSDKIAELNYNRFQDFSNAKGRAAIFTYKGDVYQHLEAQTFNKEDLEFACKNLRIISGLYGLLRPLDLLKPYRLEMAVKLPRSKDDKKLLDLYELWTQKITQHLAAELKKHKLPVIINLASKEYSGVLDRNKLDVFEITFKERRDGALKIIGINAKKMRGKMMSWIVKNKIEDHSLLKSFMAMGYEFDPKLSSERELVFIR